MMTALVLSLALGQTGMASGGTCGNCTAAQTTGTLAQRMVDVIEGAGVTNLATTISLQAAPSAGAANTAQIGSYCIWY